MKDKIITYGIIALLAGIIGYLLHPVFNKPDVLPGRNIVPDSTSTISAPDTIWKIVLKDTGRIQTRIVYVESPTPGEPDIGIKLPKMKTKKDSVELYWSYERFKPNKYVTSEIWAIAPDSVLVFENKVVTLWGDHYNDNYKPDVDFRISEQKRHSLTKGFAAGIVLAGSASAASRAGDWRILAGGILAAGGIVIFF